MTAEEESPGIPPDDLEEQPAGLFGASLDAGTFDPYPVVSLAGVDISGAPGALTGDVIVVDGVSVTWGREEVMDQPDPATGRLTLFDPTMRWALDNDLRGRPVTIRFEGTEVGASSPTSITYFSGRIGGEPVVSRKTVIHPVTGRPVRGALIELTLQSLLVDLANRVPIVDWPSETMEARRARLQAEATAAGVLDSVSIRSFWGTPTVPAVAAADQVSIYEHIVNLYDSCGADRFTYFPALRAVAAVPRKDYPSTRGVGALWWDNSTPTSARNGKGVYARTRQIAPVGGATSSPLYVDAHALEYDEADGITRPARITRVQLQHKNSAAAWATRTIELQVTGTSLEVSGVCTARVDSLVGSNAYADVALSDLEFLVRREGSAWRPGEMVLRTHVQGGFDSLTQAGALMFGAETDNIRFLQRSWLPEFGVRPIFGLMGSTIAYRNGGWEVSMHLSPITSTLRQHPITWEEIDDGSTAYEVRWYDDDHPRGMHESLTLDDLQYVSTGINVSSPGADQGWDFYA